MKEPKAIQDYRAVESKALEVMVRQTDASLAEENGPMAPIFARVAKDMAEIAAICRGQIRQWEVDQPCWGPIAPMPGCGGTLVEVDEAPG